MKVLVFAGFAIIAAIFFGIRWYQADLRADVAEDILANQRTQAQYASNMQPASFVRADDTTVTYRIPRQVTVNGQIFVNSIEQHTKIGKIFNVFGSVTGEDTDVLSQIQEGTPIRVLIKGTGSNTVIEALYVIP